jgi:competence ComEA-like helix-hairpin-helix protein
MSWSKSRFWWLLVLLGLLAAAWERRAPSWMLQDPLRSPFGHQVLPPAPEDAAPNPMMQREAEAVTAVYVNLADSTKLRALPGVGKVMAGRILELRRNQGPFHSPEDLLQVPGIGPKTLAKMRPLLRFDRPDSVAE